MYHIDPIIVLLLLTSPGYAGLSTALLADLSGIASTYDFRPDLEPSAREQHVNVLSAVHRILVQVIGSPVPRAMVYGKCLVSPARYAATHQFQTTV